MDTGTMSIISALIQTGGLGVTVAILLWVLIRQEARGEKPVETPQSFVLGNRSADADHIMRCFIGWWRSTAAITSLVLTLASAANFVAASRVALYGIR